MPTAAPETDIDMSVTQQPDLNGRHQAVIHDTGRQRAWGGEGGTPGAASTEALKKFLGDRRAPEYIKKSGM